MSAGPHADQPPRDRPVRVVGIDPGITRCGVGIVEGPAHRPRLLTAECIRTSADAPLGQRLRTVQDRLEQLIATHRPDAVACEQVLFSNNVRTAMATGQAAGVALVAAARCDVEVARYSPTDVKLTVAGHGAADKDAVARMVAAQLGLDAPPRPADVSDALAVALCHLGRSQLGGARAEAQHPGDTSGGGDWASVLAARPHVRVAGGTATPRPGGAR